MSILNDRIKAYGQSILLSCIDRNELLYVARQRIKTEDFISTNEQNVWKKILSFDKDNKSFDIVSVCNPNYVDNVDGNDLSKWIILPEFEDVSMESFKERCEDFISLVDRNRIAHELSKLATQSIDGVLKTSADIGAKASKLVDTIFKMHPVHDDQEAHAYIRDDLKELSEMHKHGVGFGLGEFDERLGKISPKSFVLIAARPGGGKSAIMLNPVFEFCRQGRRVVVNTIEMTRAEVQQRILAKLTNIQTHKLMNGEKLNEYEQAKIGDALIEYASWKLKIKDQGLQTIDDIDAFLTMCEAKHEHVDLLVIDHFGLMNPSKRTSNPFNDYSAISKSLKQLAKKHSCVMLVLSQLNREKQPNERPSLSNLRSSGSLEEDADKVLMLWNDDGEEKITNVGVMKNRQGELFEMKFKFYPAVMTYYNMKGANGC